MNQSILMRIREIFSLLLGLLCLVAGSVAQADGSTATYFVHTDHLGTPQVMTDINQDIVWKADYNPFGMAAVTTALVENNVRFSGQYFDSETGLHYNYFRDYDPTAGRYIESDPIGLQGGMNTYAYVDGNPLINIDPKGLESIVDWDLPGGGENIWVGVGGSLYGHMFIGGIGESDAQITNLRTGESCNVLIGCIRVGPGIFAEGAITASGNILGPACGKDLNGASFNIAAGYAVPGFGGYGGEIDKSSKGLGVGAGTKYSQGAGAYVGIGMCDTKVLFCSNTPDECKNCEK